MIQITFPEPVDAEWIAWRAECDRKQKSHDQDWIAWRKEYGLKPKDDKPKPKPAADSKVYGGQKIRVYLNPEGPFHGKCAYCEQLIESDQHGDVDHFRPKGAVKDKFGKPVRVTIEGIEQDHPGYYWLAYSWQNLLPTCQLCNQPNRRRVQGKTAGKRDYFPLADESKRATAPGKEEDESPLLIHPVLDDPAKYLRMDSTGVFFAEDGPAGRGQACIETLGLNSKGLAERRAAVYSDTMNLMVSLVTLALIAPNSEELRTKLERLDRIKAGGEALTAAARLAIQDAEQRLGHLLKPIL